MSKPSHQLLRLAPEVVFQAIDSNEGCLLDLRQRSFFSLNGTALVIVENLARGSTRAQIVEALAKRFKVSKERCARDADLFLCDLEKAGLLQVE